MASTLRDDLASLKIERGVGRSPSRSDRPYRSDSGGMRLISALIWLIPLGMLTGLGAFGYKKYDEFRSKPQVAIGLVQAMTSGEAEKLLMPKVTSNRGTRR